MMRMKSVWIATGLAAVMMSGRLEAQARFGTNVSWGSDTHIGLGARVGFGLGELTKKSKIEGQATFDFFFPRTFNAWEVTGNALYLVAPGGSVAPYVGAGLGYSYYGAKGTTGAYSRSLLQPVFSVGGLGSNNSNFFLNLLGGVRFKPTGNIQPFAEGRVEIGNGSQLVLTGGVFFGRK